MSGNLCKNAVVMALIFVALAPIAPVRAAGIFGSDDREAIRDAQRRGWNTARGERVYWRDSGNGSRSFAYGSLHWEREGTLVDRDGGRYRCREYKKETYVRGRGETVVTYHVCRDHDGSWFDVEENEVDYSGDRGSSPDLGLNSRRPLRRAPEPTTFPTSRPVSRSVP